MVKKIDSRIVLSHFSYKSLLFDLITVYIYIYVWGGQKKYQLRKFFLCEKSKKYGGKFTWKRKFVFFFMHPTLKVIKGFEINICKILNTFLWTYLFP